jgi:site-specific DNA recombinase
MKRGVIYARVSTRRQEQEQTIQSQIADLVEFCRERQILVQEQYIDDGYSGTLLSRPALDRLRDEARQGLFDLVVIHSVDRLSRNHIHAGIVKEELQKYNVEVVFLRAPATDTPEGQLLFDIQSVVAQYEKEKIKERMRRGKIYKAKQGRLIGHTAPYGYHYDRNNPERGYQIHSEEAAVVRMIYEWYVSGGYSIQAIRRALFKRGIPAPKGGATWGASTLNRLLTNETYSGTMYYNKRRSCEPSYTKRPDGYKRITNTARRPRPQKDWLPIRVPAILTPGVLERAQEQRRINLERSPRNSHYPYLFRGVIRHRPCQGKMHGCRKQEYPYYRCSNRIRRAPLTKTCDGSIRADILDDRLWHVVQSILTSPATIWWYVQHKEKTKHATIARLRAERSDIEGRLGAMKHKEQKLVEGYADGLFSASQVRMSMADLQRHQQALHAELAQAEEKLKHATEMPGKDQVLHLTHQYAEEVKAPSFEKKRLIVQRMVHDVVVSPPQKAILTLNLPMADSPLRKGEKPDIASLPFLRLEHKTRMVQLVLRVDLKTKEHALVFDHQIFG